MGAPTAGARRAPSERASHRDGRVVERRGAPPVVRVVLRALLIAALVGVGYVGYLQIENAEPGHARTIAEGESPEPTVDPDAPSLGEVVLALADLPSGWEAQAVDAAADDICQGRTPRSVIQPLELTVSGFTRGEAGPFITNVVATFADEDTAEAFLDLTARTIESCRTYEVEGGTAIELSPLEFPNFGDESFVVEAIGESPYGALGGDIIYVRVGNRVSSVETIAFGEDSISPELVEHLTRLVANRM